MIDSFYTGSVVCVLCVCVCAYAFAHDCENEFKSIFLFFQTLIIC